MSTFQEPLLPSIHQSIHPSKVASLAFIWRHEQTGHRQNCHCVNHYCRVAFEQGKKTKHSFTVINRSKHTMITVRGLQGPKSWDPETFSKQPHSSSSSCSLYTHRRDAHRHGITNMRAFIAGIHFYAVTEEASGPSEWKYCTAKVWNGKT